MPLFPEGCTLTPEEQRAQFHDLLPGLLPLATDRVELSTGYRYSFENEPRIVSRIGNVVDRQRQCCRFFRFHLALDPDVGPITLEVSGPEGAKAFLADLPPVGPSLVPSGRVGDLPDTVGGIPNERPLTELEAIARFFQLTDEIGRQVEAPARSPDLGRMIDEAADLMAIINKLQR
jgi:hypothetical protein